MANDHPSPVWRPYLVQRAVYVPLPDATYRDATKENYAWMISDHFDLHYMGSSEFEFGAVPESIRALDATKKLKVHNTGIQSDSGDLLRVLCRTDQLPRFKEWVEAVRNSSNPIHADYGKERLRFWVWFQRMPEVRYRKNRSGEQVPVKKDVAALTFEQRDVLERNSRTSFGYCDVWWDLGNHLVWSFSEAALRCFQEALPVSVQYMNDRKANKRVGA